VRSRRGHLGRPPEGLRELRVKATVQRALEGLSRSLAKELKKAIGVQLVYVAEGAEDQLESTLRFLLSPRSAYVSAQVIRVGAPVGDGAAPTDWAQPLAGKKVLVTGASRGIGASIAEVMAREGASVICLDVPQAQAGLDEVAAKSRKAKRIVLDIGAAEAPQTLVDAAQADGGWDVIVHNAGITRDKTIANMKEHLWQMVVNVNLSTQERINDALVASGALQGLVGASCACRRYPALRATWGRPTTPFQRPVWWAWCRVMRRCMRRRASPSMPWPQVSLRRR
jgi:3-oxoacyl-[acyl-carrier protein] reductase